MTLARAPKPVLAAIDGDAIGGGLGLAMACDVRLATAGSRFGMTPAKLGLVYPLHDTKLLVDAVGPAQTKRMLFTARIMDAAEAVRIGLIDEVVHDLAAAVDDFATRVASLSATTQIAAKAIVRPILDGATDDDAGTSAQFDAAFASADFAAGVAAFQPRSEAPTMTFDKSRLPSRHVTVGPERAPHRSYYYAMGLTAEDIAKPFVGVVSAGNDSAPCNTTLDAQADAARAGVIAAGGTPRRFNTITVTDGIAMGHQGMKSSLVSREVIADSVELSMRGHSYDALLAFAGCDKSLPGMMMAMLRLNVPSVFVYGGSILPGRFEDKDVTVVDVFEAVGQFAAGDVPARPPDRARKGRVPRPRRVRRAVHREHHGVRRRGDRAVAAQLEHDAGALRGPRRARGRGGRGGDALPRAQPPPARHLHATSL